MFVMKSKGSEAKGSPSVDRFALRPGETAVAWTTVIEI